MLYDWSMESNYITDKWRRILRSKIQIPSASKLEEKNRCAKIKKCEENFLRGGER